MNIREAMTPNPVTLQSSSTVLDAARAMSEHNVGDVIVRKNGKLCGIVTDRDIVVRVLAAGKDPKTTKLETICSQEIATVSQDQSTGEAVQLMKDRAVRRLPVMNGKDVVGIVSLGDLAVQLDRGSALGNISAAPPNH